MSIDLMFLDLKVFKLFVFGIKTEKIQIVKSLKYTGGNS